MNIGIDFGSTYSMLSYIHPVDNTLKGIAPTGQSPHIHSIVCEKDGKLISGNTAKSFSANRPNMPTYRAFKMLLPEIRQDVLRDNGYDSQHTPETISREFLKQQITGAMRTLKHREPFQQVTICVPHVWDTDVSTFSGKNALLKVCNQLIEEDKLMKSVQIVSEPAAATACFAYNYQTVTKKPYEGWILIIDYGGGTLDVTLSQVRAIAKAGTDEKVMEITVKGKTGAGENHDQRIGDAGLAYMRGVVAQALREQGIKDPPQDHQFMKAVDELETMLIQMPEIIIDKVEGEYYDDPDALRRDDEWFCSVSYNHPKVPGGELPITCGVLARVYDSLIQPVLNKALDQIFEKMRYELGMEAPGDRREGLKIAVVGGFGQYCLVQRQVNQYFNIGDNMTDPRLHGLEMQGDAAKEDAVSYGAALIANDKVRLKKIAPFSIGLALVPGNGKKEYPAFAFRSNQPLDPGKIYYLERSALLYIPDGAEDDPSKFPMKLAIAWDNDPGVAGKPNRARKLIPSEEIRRKMLSIRTNLYNVGFSIDQYEIITFWAVPTDTFGNRRVDRAVSKKLGNFADIFGSGAVQLTQNELIEGEP